MNKPPGDTPNNRPSDPLRKERARIDKIDAQILDLLKERNQLADDVLETKITAGLPIFVPEREQQKVEDFRAAAAAHGLDAEWAEDLLRMIMSASRARQSEADFPRATTQPHTVLIVGGKGKLGKLYGRMFTASGHTLRVLDVDDWDRAAELVDGIDIAIVSVPIRDPEAVIARLAPLLAPEVVLADVTSHKERPLAAMLAAHPGPVVGLHPMHGPDVANLSKQLLIVCPGRQVEAAEWLLDQARLWGMRVKQLDPQRHDEVMHLVQGLRHFIALLHGSFMRASGLSPADILDISSPIYRAELMMTGRIFAQSAELYADIVFADERRRELLLSFLDHHSQLAELVRQDDKDGFMREFRAIGEFFGDFAEQAMVESGYLIHRLADRFA